MEFIYIIKRVKIFFIDYLVTKILLIQLLKKNLLIIGGGANILALIKILNLDIKYEFIETIKLSNKQETQLMSCNSAQNLFVNGCSSEAVAISMEKQKEGVFTRFFQFFN